MKEAFDFDSWSRFPAAPAWTFQTEQSCDHLLSISVQKPVDWSHTGSVWFEIKDKARVYLCVADDRQYVCEALKPDEISFQQQMKLEIMRKIFIILCETDI